MQKTDKTPLISILMNCFNGETYLKDALNSIISQSYSNWELIFWDNLSTDNSIKIVSSYKDKRIKIFKSHKHTNLGRARKDALKKTRGDYLTFLDVDDIWHKDKLNKQIKEFDKNEDIGISFTNTIFFSSNNKENLYKNKINFKVNTNSLIINYPLSLESIMIKMSQLKLIEYSFDEKFNHISDFDLIVRLSSVSKVKYLDEVLSYWRIHFNNESFKRKNIFNEEINRWCEFHLKNKYLTEYTKNIEELKRISLAKKRIMNIKYYLISIMRFNLKSIIKSQNKPFILFSYIPFLPKLVYKVKDIIFKLKWA